MTTWKTWVQGKSGVKICYNETGGLNSSGSSYWLYVALGRILGRNYLSWDEVERVLASQPAGKALLSDLLLTVSRCEIKIHTRYLIGH